MNYNEIIKECYSFSDFAKKLGFSTNGRDIKKVKGIIAENKIDVLHFKDRFLKKSKYIVLEKKCPICDTPFKTKNNKKEKTTCSKACSNTYFRSGINHANFKNIEVYNSRSSQFCKKYRNLCFQHHPHKCVICNEDKILDVHHFDENKFNNEIDNLIPICATHHNYLHSEYRCEIIDKVIEYRNKFIMEYRIGV